LRPRRTRGSLLAMPTNDREPIRELVKELDRLLDTQPDPEVRDMIWELMMDVQEYRRKKDQEKKS